jgi:hypothetical protein
MERAARARYANLLLGLWLLSSAFLWAHSPAQFRNSWSVGSLCVVVVCGRRGPGARGPTGSLRQHGSRRMAAGVDAAARRTRRLDRAQQPCAGRRDHGVFIVATRVGIDVFEGTHLTWTA